MVRLPHVADVRSDCVSRGNRSRTSRVESRAPKLASPASETMTSTVTSTVTLAVTSTMTSAVTCRTAGKGRPDR